MSIKLVQYGQPVRLCKQPRCDSHFHVHVSSIFCKVSPFFFNLTRPLTWFFDFFLSLTFLTLFTVPNLILTPFLMFLPIYLIFHTSLSSFKLELLQFSSFRFYPNIIHYECEFYTCTEELYTVRSHHTSNFGGMVSRQHASKQNSQRYLNWFTRLQIWIPAWESIWM